MSSDQSDTRTRILQASLDLLEQGPAKLPRMSDIARAAGISRQALYLHFQSRTDLLVETTRYQDQQLGVDRLMAPSRSATTGQERLDAFVTAWARYLPRIWNVARAIMVVSDAEPEAKAALDQRIADVRQGFEAAVDALIRDGHIAPGRDMTRNIDLLSSLMSFRSYESLRIDHGWSEEAFVATMQSLARTLILGDASTLTEALDAPGNSS